MVTIRSVNEIILSLIDFFKLAQPDLDSKPGTVARDLFIDAPASQLSILYDEISNVSNQQSLRLVIGSDLDKLAKNFGVVRRQASPASGAALLTFSSINAPININRGDTVIANNGFGFAVATGVSVVPSAINFYRAVATKFSDQLAFAGISDQYAVQVTVTATSPGSVGNIGKYSLNKTNIPGVSNVTNVNPFNGGTDQETDAAFRNRVLATFSGSSVGTALGYLNVALGTTGVGDAVVIEPGDPLMVRDGTVVKKNADGSNTIISEGSGGKVDVVILGSNLVENSDSFIYRDKSNNNDPTSSKNNVVLGQISGDENKTINRKRIDEIKNGQLPQQPVDSILQVTGSVSGSNFIPKSVDTFGRVTGNFELLKDSGVYGGSPFGFDTFHWVSDRISLFNEDKIKGQFNGQDVITFTDVLEIPQSQQSISITNENSTVTSDRSIIKLLHTPATNVTRVFNVNTGERYIITNQNLDQTGTFNQTGRIQLSGNTLPSPSDLLQVDYNWIVDFDQYSDYDGLSNTVNPRPVTDSVDWGYAAAVRNEKVVFDKSLTNNFFTGTTSLPINNVITAKTFLELDGVVQLVTSGTFVNRLSIVVDRLLLATSSIDSINFKNSNTELYQTPQGNGAFFNTTEVVGIEVRFVTTIILPTDTVAVNGDRVSIVLNSTDVFTSTTSQGSSNGTQVTIPSDLIDTLANSITLLVTYISNVSDLFSSANTSLPASRLGNGFILSNNNGFNNFSIVNVSRRENQVVQQNLSLQFFVELNLPSSDFALVDSQVVSVIRLSDGKELWNSDNEGTISIGSSGNYQLIFSGLNSPLSGDRVLIIYYADDVRRFQPFNYDNSIIKTRLNNLAIDPGTGKFTIPINEITSQLSGLTFNVMEPNTDIILFSIADGYLVANTDGTAFLSSLTTNFATLPDLLHKKIKIFGATNPNNNGTYDILDYDINSNLIFMSQVLSKITTDQIMVVRVLDGQEIWNYSGTIDVAHNKILIPATSAAQFNDKVFVMFFNFNNLRKAPTRLIGTTVDQVVNTGVLTINGTTLNKASNIVFTATNTGLKLNLSEAIRKALSLSSVATIPSNVRLAKIIKAEKVTTTSIGSDDVLTVLATYDVNNTTIQNNLLYADDMLADPLLQSLDFVLPNTQNNTLNTDSPHLPKLGDKIRITFYYVTDNDSENLSYTRNGTLYTNKKFALINKMFVASGFKASQSTKFTATSFTQPGLGARYKIFYDYLAPKQNERILVRYNYNKLISDVTFNIENTRPINADVLARGAKLTLLDLTMNVVITDSLKSSTTTILQNLRDQLVTAMTTTTLGSIVDVPTLINIAQAVNGIARARVLYFNKNGIAGQVLSVQAQKDEFFASNNIIINTETR